MRAPDLRATEVGMMMGTPAYMAPEQVQGARDADPRSDVWALGVMMFELIAGRMPFDIQDAPALFVAIATRDAPTLLDVGAEVTPAISRLVERCLRRQPDDRYPTAAELGRDLRHVIDNTEMEPTGRRSLPPNLVGKVPELSLPKSDPLPQIGAPRGSYGSSADVDAGGETELGYATPEAPSLLPSAPSRKMPEAPELEAPAPRASAVKAQPKPAPRPQPIALESDARASSRIATNEALSGVMLAGSSTSKRTAAHGMYAERPTRDVADMAPLVGLAVVGLVAILGTGLLMQLVHRPEGWAIARFLVGPSQTGILAIQGGLALVAMLVGGNYFWRGIRHWRGDLSGGPPNAIVCAVVAAGAFFAAIELVSAAY